MVGWIKMPLDTEVGLGPDHIVLAGDPAPPERGPAAPTHFLAHVFCGQSAGWIRIPLGMEVGLGPGDNGSLYLSLRLKAKTDSPV